MSMIQNDPDSHNPFYDQPYLYGVCFQRWQKSVAHFIIHFYDYQAGSSHSSLIFDWD